MPTRRQSPNAREFRQEAFASSIEFERGVLGNIVARRCEKVSDREVVAVLWWLQQISWREGGLEKFAAEFIESHRHLIGTRSMHEFGLRPGQRYNADQVRVVRDELPGFKDEFPLRDDPDAQSRYLLCDLADSYPVEDFIECCELRPTTLAECLKRKLVDPEKNPTNGLRVMPGLWSALCAARDTEARSFQGKIVETEVTRRVFDELDFALEARTFVLIEGREGIGKTEAARAWCQTRPGRALYVSLEAGVDEATLYRSIAQRLGTACSYGRKATEMRMRIQDALQPGQLMLVLDEAHHLWPSSGRCERAAPKRVDWLRTALIDFGVPVALLSTPQYFERACDRFRKAGWNSLQIQRRLARTAVLPEPDAIPLEDVLAVVRSYFPDISQREAEHIAALAILSVGFLTTIKHIRQRFEFLSSRRSGGAAGVLAETLEEFGPTRPETPPGGARVAAQTPFKGQLRRPKTDFPAMPISRGGTSPRLIVQPEPSAV